MGGIENIGRLLIIFGLGLALVGVLFLVVGRIPGVGRLPGDIVIERPGFTCIAPIATMLIVSVVLTIVLNILIRILNR